MKRIILAAVLLAFAGPAMAQGTGNWLWASTPEARAWLMPQMNAVEEEIERDNAWKWLRSQAATTPAREALCG